MDKVKPVGIWVRVSTEDQTKGESGEHHEKRASFYAESKGWKVKMLSMEKPRDLTFSRAPYPDTGIGGPQRCGKKGLFPSLPGQR